MQDSDNEMECKSICMASNKATKDVTTKSRSRELGLNDIPAKPYGCKISDQTKKLR